MSKAAIYSWEKGRTNPSIRQLSGLIRFLGYDPYGSGSSLPERLAAYRRAKGLSQRRFAAEFGLDPSTIARWEAGRGRPSARMLRRIQLVFEDHPAAPNPPKMK